MITAFKELNKIFIQPCTNNCYNAIHIIDYYLGKNNLLILCCGLIIPGIKDLGLVVGDGGLVGVPVITDLLGNPLAHPDRALLVHSVTLLHRPLAALLQRLVLTHLVRDLATSLAGHIRTLLLS